MPAVVIAAIICVAVALLLGLGVAAAFVLRRKAAAQGKDEPAVESFPMDGINAVAGASHSVAEH